MADASVSELLSSLDPEEEVPLPDFIECRLATIPHIAQYIRHHPVTTREARVELCTGCIPRLSFEEAFVMLPILEFLDIRAGVEMLFAYIKDIVSRWDTVDDAIRCMYPQFESLPLTEQRSIYEVLLINFSVFRD